MKIYFVTCANRDEIKIISELKPKNILISYFYFRTREKLLRFINNIGYAPNILFDSGAFSSMTKGKDLSLTAYMRFLKDNSDIISEYVQLDVFQKEFITKAYYDVMKSEGLHPIPVFHYGFNESLLEYFINQGEKRIALGGTVPIKNKNKVSEWLKFFCWQYPEIDFHLLGSSSLKILDNCDVNSVDASTWILEAANGRPASIKTKTGRMKHNMAQLMKYEEETE